MIMAGLEVWDPAAIVLDLTNLANTWGDRMVDVLTAPAHEDLAAALAAVDRVLFAAGQMDA